MRPAISLNGWLRYDGLTHFLSAEKSGQSFLEIGCGRGAFGARLAARFRYVAYEPDWKSFEVAKKRIGEQGEVVNAELPAVPTRTFDLVGAFEVLEHLKDDEAVLRSWARWLNPGGRLLMTVPAGPHRMGTWDIAVGHYRRYSAESITRVLRAVGFRRIEVISLGFPFGYVLDAVRNRLAPRDGLGSTAERTLGSGRFLQPTDRVAWLTWAAALPMRAIQRPFKRSRVGTALAVRAVRPT